MSKPTAVYSSLTLDTTGTGIVSQAGATLLTITVTKTGLHQESLSAALSRWRVRSGGIDVDVNIDTPV